MVTRGTSDPPWKRHGPSNFRKRARRGMTAVLAMFYLALFSALAVGFYAATNTSSQISGNERRGVAALAAAESGMEFIRYSLARVRIPPGTNDAAVAFDRVYADLQAQLNGSANLGGQVVSRQGDVITIPTVFLEDDPDGARFSATLTLTDDTVRVVAAGRSRDMAITRSVRLDYQRRGRSSSIFDCAVASKGRITMRKGSLIGNPSSVMKVMSASPDATALSLNGGAIGDCQGGQLAVISDKSQAALNGTTVHGTNCAPEIREHYLDVTSPPDFPYIDTEYFRQFAVNPYRAGGPHKNILVPANTNPRFNGGDVIQGIMFVESPNTITFRGNATLQGFIVFQNAGDPTQNILDFSGSVNQAPLPAGAEFDPLRAITGYYIAAPTAFVKFWGSFDAVLSGSLICAKFDIGGAATATFNQGSLITLSSGTDSATFEGSKFVKFNGGTGSNAPTSGITYSQFFVPLSGSYRELNQ